MVYYINQMWTFGLMFLVAFFTSCNGQVNSNTSTVNVNQQQITRIAAPKMIRKQGVYSYMTHTGPHTDTSVSINSIIEDRKGNIWVATMGEGVYRYDGDSFDNFTMKDGLATNVIYCIMEDREGNLWFGTTDGVSRYDGKSFISFPFSYIRHSATTSLGPETTVPGPYNEVWSMLQDKKGMIWLGTTNGVYRYDGSKFTNLLDLGTPDAGSPNLSAVPAIIEDKSGNIWFTSWHVGLCRFDGATITVFGSEGHLLSGNGLLEDQNGDIWIAQRGNGGVDHYDGKDFKGLFPGMIVTSMKEDGTGNIWFATFDRAANSGSVLLYNPSTGEIMSSFSAIDGESNSHITSIEIDAAENIWFGTNKMTLVRYDGKTLTVFLPE